MLLVVERLRKFCDVMLRMVDLLMRMRRALCWMHLEAICRLCSSLDFPTMLAMALNSAVMGNFLGLSFLWVIPVELSLWTGQTETWLILCLPALPGKNRSNRFPPLTIVHSIRLCVCCCCCALWFVVLLWCVVVVVSGWRLGSGVDTCGGTYLL